MKLERILVPVDFSDPSNAAVDYAIEVVRQAGGKLLLLHAYPTNPGAITPYEPALPDGFFEAYREVAREQIEKVRVRVEAAGIEVEAHLSTEAPGHAIAESAESLEADLIVMGTHGRTGLSHMLLGSVAERTVRLAPCPVLTVGDRHERSTR